MNALAPADSEPRFLLYHLHPISARLLFVRHASGSVLTPRPLPLLSSPMEDEEPEWRMDLNEQINLGLKLNERLGFEPGMLLVEREFLRRAEIPRAKVNLHLARFSPVDAPHGEVRETGGEFRPLTELHGGNPVEMSLLRWAFEFLLGS